jgi:hypothetical protein
MGFRTFSVGRSDAADLRMSEPEISRRQVELTLTAEGRVFIVDCASSCGTSLWRDDQWTPLVQGYVNEDDSIAFGTHKFRVKDLLHRLTERHLRQPAVPAAVISVKPRRKVDTGEVQMTSGKGAR